VGILRLTKQHPQREVNVTKMLTLLAAAVIATTAAGPAAASQWWVVSADAPQCTVSKGSPADAYAMLTSMGYAPNFIEPSSDIVEVAKDADSQSALVFFRTPEACEIFLTALNAEVGKYR
jgi:hypothetical protein